MRKINLILIMFFSLNSCYKNNKKICEYKENIISQKEIFNFKGEYYVFVYLDKCMACRDVKLKLMNFCQKGEKMIYYLDLLTTNFFQNKKRDNNLYLNDDSLIYVDVVPHLFYIKNCEINNEWIGFNDISEHIFQEL